MFALLVRFLLGAAAPPNPPLRATTSVQLVFLLVVPISSVFSQMVCFLLRGAAAPPNPPAKDNNLSSTVWHLKGSLVLAGVVGSGEGVRGWS